MGIVTAESGLRPARALLNHGQDSFARRLHARPKDGDGPKEILERDRSALTTSQQAGLSSWAVVMLVQCEVVLLVPVGGRTGGSEA